MLSALYKYRYFSFLFFVSGFAGIIYESVWTQYARIVFGHAAFAQTFVLILFLGGLALGAWIGGKIVPKSARLFLLYALAEVLLGILALLFNHVFTIYHDLVFNVIHPGFTVKWAEFLKWMVILAITLPSTLLIGATFPFIATAMQREMPGRGGRVVSQFYFINSMGAATGILASGFVLIPAEGLPGTMITAGMINIAVFLMALPFIHYKTKPEKSTKNKYQRDTGKRDAMYFLVLVAALFTGASSFMYEIAWVRMLSMVLGSSVQSFELMLSAFIAGLAIGAWWIKRRIDRIKNLLEVFMTIQMLMGIFAIASLVIYNSSFVFMEWLFQTVERNIIGYYAVQAISHLLSLMVMLPATICAGMTLPLMIRMLQKRNYREDVIGKVYAIDTGGGIIGVVLAVHLLMPLIGLKFLIIIAGVLDILIAFVFFAFLGKGSPLVKALMAGSFFVVVLASVFIHPDPVKMASGVFRYGMIDRTNRVLFHKDGKTATIAIYETNSGNIVLSTNGKPDASVNIYRQVSGDEATQVLLAALPMDLYYGAENVAVIGLGSGKTTHTALMNFKVKRLTAIEIERAVAEATHYFRPYNENIFTDARFNLQIADARTFLAASSGNFDMIISEPSNPWVSGNASLFSTEFYRMGASKLNAEGMFVQWVHTYEINLPLIASIVKAFSPAFEDYRIYYLDDGDMAIIGSTGGKVPGHTGRIFRNPELQVELSRLGLTSIDDLQLRYLGDKALLDPLFYSYDTPPNSDYFPLLEYQAPKARFLQNTAGSLKSLLTFPAPVMRSFQNSDAVVIDSLGKNYPFNLAGKYRTARQIYNVFQHPGGESDSVLQNLPGYNRLLVENMLALAETEKAGFGGKLIYLKEFAQTVMPYLDSTKLNVIWKFIRTAKTWPELPEDFRDQLMLYEAAGNQDYDKILELTGDLKDKLLILPVPSEEYRLAVTMWALLMTGREHEIPGLWEKYEHPHHIPLMLRLLAARAGIDVRG